MTLLTGPCSSPLCPSSPKPDSQRFANARRLFVLPLKLACVALLLGVTLISAWAQSTATGTVSGQITDQMGAVIAGGTVTLIDKATGTSRTTTANEVGRYIFVNVAPGPYHIQLLNPSFPPPLLSTPTSS